MNLKQAINIFFAYLQKDAGLKNAVQNNVFQEVHFTAVIADIKDASSAAGMDQLKIAVDIINKATHEDLKSEIGVTGKELITPQDISLFKAGVCYAYGKQCLSMPSDYAHLAAEYYYAAIIHSPAVVKIKQELDDFAKKGLQISIVQKIADLQVELNVANQKYVNATAGSDKALKGAALLGTMDALRLAYVNYSRTSKWDFTKLFRVVETALADPKVIAANFPPYVTLNALTNVINKLMSLGYISGSPKDLPSKVEVVDAKSAAVNVSKTAAAPASAAPDTKSAATVVIDSKSVITTALVPVAPLISSVPIMSIVTAKPVKSDVSIKVLLASFGMTLEELLKKFGAVIRRLEAYSPKAIAVSWRDPNLVRQHQLLLSSLKDATIILEKLNVDAQFTFIDAYEIYNILSILDATSKYLMFGARVDAQEAEQVDNILKWLLVRWVRKDNFSEPYNVIVKFKLLCELSNYWKKDSLLKNQRILAKKYEKIKLVLSITAISEVDNIDSIWNAFCVVLKKLNAICIFLAHAPHRDGYISQAVTINNLLTDQAEQLVGDCIKFIVKEKPAADGVLFTILQFNMATQLLQLHNKFKIERYMLLSEEQIHLLTIQKIQCEKLYTDYKAQNPSTYAAEISSCGLDSSTTAVVADAKTAATGTAAELVGKYGAVATAAPTTTASPTATAGPIATPKPTGP